MPAHRKLEDVGALALSDGTLLSPIDWRANRLVDGLAKQQAWSQLPYESVDAILRGARAAARHAAKLLGQVTRAANHHIVESTGPDGVVKKEAWRDATQARRTSSATISETAPVATRSTTGVLGEADLAKAIEEAEKVQLGGQPTIVEAESWRRLGPTPNPADLALRSSSTPPAARVTGATQSARQAAARRHATKRRREEADWARTQLLEVASAQAPPAVEDRFGAILARTRARAAARA